MESKYLEHIKVRPLSDNEIYLFNVYDKSWNLLGHHYSGSTYSLQHYGDFTTNPRNGNFVKLMDKVKAKGEDYGS